ncbi:copper-binding protein [Roseateles sp. BYS180W]|uniref:Copper-binding protein n=1 Tax=Roseateles rivi TaxID=3299028 RepID=A0ABW7FSK6_9BURK
MKLTHHLILCTLALTGLSAQAHHHDSAEAPAATASAAQGEEWVAAEVRRIDPEQRKLTLRHGDIKSMQMMGMTMVFKADAGVSLEGLAVGDRIEFRPVRRSEGFVLLAWRRQP